MWDILRLFQRILVNNGFVFAIVDVHVDGTHFFVGLHLYVVFDMFVFITIFITIFMITEEVIFASVVETCIVVHDDSVFDLVGEEAIAEAVDLVPETAAGVPHEVGHVNQQRVEPEEEDCEPGLHAERLHERNRAEDPRHETQQRGDAADRDADPVLGQGLPHQLLDHFVDVGFLVPLLQELLGPLVVVSSGDHLNVVVSDADDQEVQEVVEGGDVEAREAALQETLHDRKEDAQQAAASQEDACVDFVLPPDHEETLADQQHDAQRQKHHVVDGCGLHVVVQRVDTDLTHVYLLEGSGHQLFAQFDLLILEFGGLRGGGVHHQVLPGPDRSRHVVGRGEGQGRGSGRFEYGVGG